MMLLGIFKNTEGKQESKIYYNWNKWHKDTFSPAIKIIAMVLFKINGKTYAERKESLRQVALAYQVSSSINLSYGELANINYFFEKNAKKYGLLREFKENGII